MILVDNALKYSPSDSLVTIKLSKRNNKACFEITNTGEGISPDDLPHIFDRFYRADGSRTGGKKSGYGLGLALAKKIVEIHNGDLYASSAIAMQPHLRCYCRHLGKLKQKLKISLYTTFIITNP